METKFVIAIVFICVIVATLAIVLPIELTSTHKPTSTPTHMSSCVMTHIPYTHLKDCKTKFKGDVMPNGSTCSAPCYDGSSTTISCHEGKIGSSTPCKISCGKDSCSYPDPLAYPKNTCSSISVSLGVYTSKFKSYKDVMTQMSKYGNVYPKVSNDMSILFKPKFKLNTMCTSPGNNLCNIYPKKPGDFTTFQVYMSANSEVTKSVIGTTSMNGCVLKGEHGKSLNYHNRSKFTDPTSQKLVNEDRETFYGYAKKMGFTLQVKPPANYAYGYKDILCNYTADCCSGKCNKGRCS